VLPICNNSGDGKGGKGPRGGGFHEGGESLAEAVRETTVGAMVVEVNRVSHARTQVHQESEINDDGLAWGKMKIV
jgi:hypothetical protein